jgi:hypothetical protein
MDGLLHRASRELALEIGVVGGAVAKLCRVDQELRDGCLQRVADIARRYVDPPGHGPLTEALFVNWGLEARSSAASLALPELATMGANGETYSCLGDLKHAVAGWLAYLAARSEPLPVDAVIACGVTIAV